MTDWLKEAARAADTDDDKRLSGFELEEYKVGMRGTASPLPSLLRRAVEDLRADKEEPTISNIDGWINGRANNRLQTYGYPAGHEYALDGMDGFEAGDTLSEDLNRLVKKIQDWESLKGGMNLQGVSNR